MPLERRLPRAPQGPQLRGVEFVELPLVIEFDADFADIFEVRGLARWRAGACFPRSRRRRA